MKPIPLLLVTGFLGSGKTTLINRLLKEGIGDDNKKIGILVNDFGDVPVDAILLDHQSGDAGEVLVHEISGGSIFCSCLKGSFIMGLKYFTNARPDLLVLEASGMSDPASFGKIINDHGMAGDFSHRGTLCLADPMRILQLSSVLPAVANQIAVADLVVLNKTDLAKEGEIEASLKQIDSLHPGVEVIQTTNAKIDITQYIQGRGRLFNEPEVDGQTPSDRPSTVSLPQKSIPMEKLLIFLNKLIPKVLRIKGFYRFDGVVYFVEEDGRQVTARPLERDEKTPDEVDLGITVLAMAGTGEDIISMWKVFLSGLGITKSNRFNSLVGSLGMKITPKKVR